MGRPPLPSGEKVVVKPISFPPDVAEALAKLPRGTQSAFVTKAVRRALAELPAAAAAGAEATDV